MNNSQDDNRASGDPLPVPVLSHPHAEQCHQAGWCCCPACSCTEQLILSRLMLLPSMLMDRTADTEQCHKAGWCWCPARSRTFTADILWTGLVECPCNAMHTFSLYQIFKLCSSATELAKPRFCFFKHVRYLIFLERSTNIRQINKYLTPGQSAWCSPIWFTTTLSRAWFIVSKRNYKNPFWIYVLWMVIFVFLSKFRMAYTATLMQIQSSRTVNIRETSELWQAPQRQDLGRYFGGQTSLGQGYGRVTWYKKL
jgi:hypothetical protein